MDFVDECFSNGLSIDRTLFYLNRLYKVAQWLKKDFREATKDDLKTLVRNLELNGDYSARTKSDYKVTLKRFYKWLEEYEDGYPEKVRWIKTGIKQPHEKMNYLQIVLRIF